MARTHLAKTKEEVNGRGTVAGRIILPRERRRDFLRAGTGGLASDLFTVTELARALGCSPEGVRGWLKMGWLVADHVTVGGRVILRRETVRKMLRERAR